MAMNQELREFLHVVAYFVSKCPLEKMCNWFLVIEQYSLIKSPHGLGNVYKLPTVFALHTSPQAPHISTNTPAKKVTHTAQIAYPGLVESCLHHYIIVDSMIPLPHHEPSHAIQGTEEKWNSLSRLKNKKTFFMSIPCFPVLPSKTDVYQDFATLLGFF